MFSAVASQCYARAARSTSSCHLASLVNLLLATDVQVTGGIREHDAKGRHTTTSRQMFALSTGAWVIDTPGMRELKPGAVEGAVAAVFDDIESLARDCRFRDCRHRSDAGCALDRQWGRMHRITSRRGRETSRE